MARIQGTDSNENLGGTRDDDTILGMGGNDVLYPSEGNDLMDGGAGNDILSWSYGSGNDTMNGGEGNDWFNIDKYWGDAAIVANGGAGDDRFVVSTSVPGSIVLSGGAGRDVYELNGGDGSTLRITDFKAGAGGDLIELGRFLDSLYYLGGNPFGGTQPLFRLEASGADTLLQKYGYLYSGGEGYSTLAILANTKPTQVIADNFAGAYQPDGAYMPGQLIEATGTAKGTTFDDTMVGGDAGDSFTGGLGADVLRGGRGNDALGGEQGDDSLYGEAGNDTLSGGKGSNLLDGGGGDDMLVSDSEAGNDTLQGGAGNDRLFIGGWASSALAGTAVADGGDGDDVITLDSHGNTTRAIVLRGGAGSDTFAYQFSLNGSQRAVIEDFAAGAGGDRIDMSGVLTSLGYYYYPAPSYLGGNPFATGHLRLVQNGADAELLLSPDAPNGTSAVILVLKNVAVGALTAANFVDGLDPAGGPIPGIAATLTRPGSSEGGFFNDSLTGSEGDDSLRGNGGDDLLRGSGGADSLVGGRGNDTLDGGSGNDTLDGSEGANLLEGGAGDDVLIVSRVSPDATVRGGEGADRLDFSTGIAISAEGGAGIDVYRPSSTTGGDGILVIADFVTGAGGDMIDLDGLLYYSWRYEGGNPFASGLFKLVQRGADTILQWDSSYQGGRFVDVIALRNVDASQVGSANFVHGVAPDGSPVRGQSITATAPDQYLHGHFYNDTLTGVNGHNQLDGGGGDDMLYAGSDGDVLDGDTGNDTLQGGAGNDSLAGGNGNDRLDGGAGNDVLIGDGGSDSLYGGTGNDRIVVKGGAGAVLYADGGAGDDHFEVPLWAWMGGTQTLHGGSGRDTYHLHWLAEMVIDDFQAGAGGDRIDLSSRLLNSRYDTDTAANPLDPAQGFVKLEQRGADVVVLVDSDGATGRDIGFNETAFLRNVKLADLVGENLIGASLDGGPLRGLEIEGTADADALTGSYLADTLSGAGADDRIEGERGDDRLDGGEGSDTIMGGSGNDVLRGGTGDDTLSGGEGNDTLYGEAGDDTLEASGSGDLIDGGDGNDSLMLNGEVGNQTLAGGSGNDSFYLYASDSSPGVVRIDGGAGDDIVTGTVSRGMTVIVAGGEGIDTYTNREALGVIRITDFQSGNGGDRLDLRISYKLDSYDPVAGGFYRFDQQGSDVVIAYDADGKGGADTFHTMFVLENVVASSLSGANFLPIEAQNMGEVHGWLGNDSLRGSYSWGEKLFGGWGDDTLDGGGGPDTLVGGIGDDVYIVRDTESIIEEAVNAGVDTVRAACDTFTLVANTEVLEYIGTRDFSGTGNGQANRLTGGAGNDTLDGKGGEDTLAGGAGDDTYILDSAGDVVIELAGGGIDTVRYAGSADVELGAGIEHGVLLAGTRLTGNAAANRLAGNAQANILSGGAGDDTLDGGGGADTLAGGSGDDVYVAGSAGIVITEQAGEGTDRVDTSLAAFTLAANIEVLRYTGTVPGFAGTGNDASNRIEGSKGNDTLGGAGGNDTLYGNGGSDVLDGGAGGDTVVVSGKRGAYALVRGNGEQTLSNALSGERITLRSIETIVFADGTVQVSDMLGNTASAFDDVLTGTSGNDTIDGLAGADQMSGKQGDDTYVVDNLGDVIVEQPGEGRDTVQVKLTKGIYTLAANVEDATIVSTGAAGLTGNELANTLTGNGAANKLEGGAGNDTLDGGKGSDVLIGGSGNDTYYVDVAGDKVTELADEGTDTVITSLAKYTLGANVENLIYTGTAAFTATGNALDNVITGGSGNNTIDGGAGKDTFVVSGAFAEYTRQRPNATDVVLTRGTQKITLKNIEQVQFSDGLKTMGDIFYNIASQANDTLAGGDGNDSLDGLAGADQLSGGKGDDTYVVDNAADTIVEKAGEGRDTVQVALAKGSYTLAANVENGVVTGKGATGIVGNELANTLTGNAAANKLDGGAGNDTLDGGKGSDVLTGGTGNDTFYVDAAGDKVIELADAGTDTVFTTLAKYTLAANVENLVYTGTAAFSATGNALDNVITGGSGNNTIDGGAGNDTFVVSGAFAEYTRQRPNATDVVLTKGTQKITLKNIEQVQFADGRKTMGDIFYNIASLADDTLVGTDGNDTMNGLAGADQMKGGKGDDTYLVDNAGDTVIEKAAEGIDTVNIAIKTKATYTLADNVEHATITSTVAVSLVGNASDNRLTGNAAANALTGGDGNDTLIGGKGSDTLDGGAGNDVYSVDAAGDKVIEGENGGYDIVETTTAKYTLAANVEELRFTGKGAFTGIGNALDNLIVGGAGNDKLTGGTGADTFVIGTGNDTITDFVSGIDRLKIDRAIGNGKGGIDGAVVLGSAGGFSSDAELVIFAQAVKSLKPADVAKVIGSATEAYANGDTALFALHDAKGTALFLFTSNGADAAVGANELVQIATLTGVSTTSAMDYGIAVQP